MAGKDVVMVAGLYQRAGYTRELGIPGGRVYHEGRYTKGRVYCEARYTRRKVSRGPGRN